ncbi:MAG: Asp-tRNA(Asn)/Glu-tRNA(Gln) amidotransferase subunit GatA [Ruminococcus sp.]|nr:Asp-tRNA(Asn)/Glu-tRNA(Gln) amidotransferase subunit GatA [Ruminococcus sp.]
MQLYEYNAFELSELLEDKSISSVELTNSVIDRINAVDKQLNAFITVCSERAIGQAKSVDEKRINGEKLPRLAGIPIGLKDNISLSGVKMTCASRMLENYIAPYNATVADKLETIGAVLIGKLNMDEFAMGSSNENSFFGAVKNPYDTNRVAGGSSGGCAVAVSAGEIPCALGSDTGGSIRQPAAFCGVVGLKPTYSAVSRYGLTAFASSFDQIGPVCRCVKDTALLFDAISGHDRRDSTSAQREYLSCYDSITDNIKGLRIGVPRTLFEDICSEDVLDSFNSALAVLEQCGAQVDNIELDNTEFALPAYYVISSAEASSNLARFDGVRYGFRASGCKDLNDMYISTRSEGFGDEVKRRIMLGTFVLSAGYYDSYYKNALSAAKLITCSIKDQFEKVDIIAMPTSPETAFKLGAKTNDPIEMYKSDVFTVFANLTGLPAISVPCGLAQNSLPVGIQFMADSFCEQRLFDAAYAYECARGAIAKPSI